jgi:ABC-type amino acid transport substrate-binding protein
VHENEIDKVDAERTGPSRRAVLVGGLAALAGGGLLAACDSGDDDDTGATGASGGPTTIELAQSSGSLLDTIIANKTVKLGVDLSFQPLQFRDPSTNEPTGYSVEVVKLMMAELGVDPKTGIEWVEVGFSELFAAQEAGRFDMAGIAATNTPARGLKVAFAGAPTFLEGNYILLKPDSSVTTSAALNASGVNIAVLAGSSQAAEAKLNFPEATLKELQDQAAAVDDVKTGRSDAVFVGEFDVANAVNNEGLKLLSEPPRFSSHNTFFMPRGDFRLWAFVTQFLQYKAADLTLANLWQQFVGADAAAAGIKTAAVVDPWLAAAQVAQA